ncbi:MAG TPA: tetratricopeptide repeat protein [Candidatus Methylacidiphilales bacterium]|nr:tetratricopeptide repeat protein [Candidatus Methylacidiphilales bacterium]
MAKRFTKKSAADREISAPRPAARRIVSPSLPPFPFRVAWPWLQAAVIALAVGWIYFPALQGDWIRDDNFDVAANAITQSPSGLWNIWFQPSSQVDYYPLKASVQWLQWQLWGNDTFGYHLTNVVLHLAGALLVWRLFAKMGLRLAWLGGLIFAVHPMQVESVAWIAELKNTLSLPLFLLAMCTWLDYEERRGRRDYWLAIALFFLAMLGKITVAPFPLVILLFAWWKRNRVTLADLKESAPFFAISIALVLLNMWTGNTYRHIHGVIADEVPLAGILSRFALAGWAIAFYFAKCFWPVPPLPLYPQWDVSSPSAVQLLPWPVLGGALCWLWRKRRSWGRDALFGLGFFLLNLTPNLGFISISYMYASWVMDHFLYVPMLGLIGLAMAGLDRLSQLLPSDARPIGIGLLAPVIALMAWSSHTYAAQFVNEETLWTYLLQKDPGSWMAHVNLGNVACQTGRLPEAVAQYNAAAQLNPASAEPHTDMGVALHQMGRDAEAIGEFKTALRIDPRYAVALNNWGGVLLSLGHTPEAIALFEQALRIYPNYGSAHSNLANAYLQSGRFQDAVTESGQALAINPANLAVHATEGAALIRLQRYPEAVEHLEAFLRANPRDAHAHNNLGIAFSLMGNMAAAIEQFQLALQDEPNNTEAHDNLGIVLENLKRIPEAIEQYQETLRLRPNDALAKAGLARLQTSAKEKTR